MASQELPRRARVVIVGGGVIGCSVAYHLARLGWQDVVLLERDRLTCGTTWHAAGLMTTFGSTSATSVELRMYTRDLWGRLEAETGHGTGFEPIRSRTRRCARPPSASRASSSRGSSSCRRDRPSRIRIAPESR